MSPPPAARVDERGTAAPQYGGAALRRREERLSPRCLLAITLIAAVADKSRGADAAGHSCVSDPSSRPMNGRFWFCVPHRSASSFGRRSSFFVRGVGGAMLLRERRRLRARRLLRRCAACACAVRSCGGGQRGNRPVAARADAAMRRADGACGRRWRGGAPSQLTEPTVRGGTRNEARPAQFRKRHVERA